MEIPDNYETLTRATKVVEIARHVGPFLLPFAESHGRKAVDECEEEGTLRSFSEGGYAAEGSARRSVWRVQRA